MSKKGKFLVGAGLGLGLGMLLAPKSGKENWNDLKKKSNELLQKVKNIDAEDVKDSITEKLTELEREIKSLNKEKVTAIAKEKANVAKEKAEELYKYAVAKGTPAVEKAAKEVKAAAVKTLKDLTSKLEKEPVKKETKKTTTK